MRYLSVCSGIEAATVAWHPLGWIPAAFAEIDKFPRAVLAHHYPAVPLHGDFTTIEAGQYGAVDLLVGGTPCQDFSIAGLRAGIAGERGNLTLEFLRLAARASARWIVWENVPGVLSSDGGRALGTFLGGLAELGYGFAYRVLDAQHFGLAQRRARVFVVGHLGDWRRAGAVLFERESLQGHPAPRREAGERVAPTISARPTGGGGLGTDFDCDGGLIAGTLEAALGRSRGAGTPPSSIVMAHGQANAEIGRDQCPTLTLLHEAPILAHALRAEGFDASEDGTGRGTPLVPVAFDCLAAGNTGFAIGDKAGALRGEGSKGGHAAVAFESRFARNGRGAPDTIVPPLKAQSGTNGKGDGAPLVAFTQNSRSEVRHIGGDGQIVGAVPADAGAQQQNYLSSGMQVRRLTPRECERLQGFPDDYTLIPWRKGLAPDGPRYKALGNSMAVPVMRWIGERIAMVEALSQGSNQ